MVQISCENPNKSIYVNGFYDHICNQVNSAIESIEIIYGVQKTTQEIISRSYGDGGHGIVYWFVRYLFYKTIFGTLKFFSSTTTSRAINFRKIYSNPQMLTNACIDVGIDAYVEYINNHNGIRSLLITYEPSTTSVINPNSDINITVMHRQFLYEIYNNYPTMCIKNNIEWYPSTFKLAREMYPTHTHSPLCSEAPTTAPTSAPTMAPR